MMATVDFEAMTKIKVFRNNDYVIM